MFSTLLTGTPHRRNRAGARFSAAGGEGVGGCVVQVCISPLRRFPGTAGPWCGGSSTIEMQSSRGDIDARVAWPRAFIVITLNVRSSDMAIAWWRRVFAGCKTRPHEMGTILNRICLGDIVQVQLFQSVTLGTAAASLMTESSLSSYILTGR